MTITNEYIKSPVAEAYRTLRTNIQFLNIDKNIKSIVITSAEAGEGKSTVAINLASSIAHTDKKVLLVDSDLRKPAIHTYVGLQNDTGLTKILTENTNYKSVVKFAGVEKLDIITAGPIPPNPAELLGSTKMRNFLDEVRLDYDMIILDSPPVGLVTDATILSTVADGTILVCAAGQIEIDALKNTKSLLNKVNANILGVVMNKIAIDKNKYDRYY